MDYLVLAVFLLVYLGMFLGEIPGLALDRTGIALLGGSDHTPAGLLALVVASAGGVVGT